MTERFTEENLYAIMRTYAGDVEGVDLSSASDTTFAELGYDSLAVLQVQAQIKRIYGIEIPDEQIDDLETPRAMTAFVNGRMAAA